MVQINIMTRIKALPQELKDEILEYAIIVKDGTVRLNRLYKPPIGLSINRATRAKTALSFYANTLFLEPIKHQGMMIKWLSSLPPAHLKLIKAILFQSYQRLVPPPVGDRRRGYRGQGGDRRGAHGTGSFLSGQLSTVGKLVVDGFVKVNSALLRKDIPLAEGVVQLELLKEGGVWAVREGVGSRSRGLVRIS